MRKVTVAAVLGLTLISVACAKKAADEGVPADTATVVPAPAPAPAETGAAAVDTTKVDTTKAAATK